MHVKFMTMLLGVAMILLCFGLVIADEGAKKEAEEVQYDYIGAKKCSLKPCHGKDGIAESWGETKHATAWDSLTVEQKKDESLVKYYVTGTTAKGKLLHNVQCESCHGPGSKYKSKKIMEDVELAKKNGLVIPTKETCVSCHHSEAPEAVAVVAKMIEEDWAGAVAKGVHALPEKEAKKAESE